MEAARFQPLLALSEHSITEACPNIPPKLLSELQQIMLHFMRGIITSQRAATIFLQKMGTTAPVNRIAAILRVPETPISGRCEPFQSVSGRRKIQSWSEYEDQRLLCAISRFGLDDWTSVAQFVGNQRTRAKCAQRWFRGLDPRISRVMWTPQEEMQLTELVQQYGPTAWTRISAGIGNRSDAQCRYHYLQMIKGGQHDDSRGNEEGEAGCERKSIELEIAPRRILLPSIDRLIGVAFG
jgi:hypothetical protein